MTTIVELNYENEITSRVTPLFQVYPDVMGRYSSIAEELQQVEQVFQRFITFKIGDAVGVGLDLIGGILDVIRDGRDDAAYRVALRNKTSSNRANGSPESVMTLMSALTQGDIIDIFEHYPASMNIYCGQGEDGELWYSYQKLLPVGVSGDVVFGTPNNTLIPSERNYIEKEFILSNGNNLELLPTFETLNVVTRAATVDKGTSVLPERGEVGVKLAERYSGYYGKIEFSSLPTDLGTFFEPPSATYDLGEYGVPAVKIDLGSFVYELMFAGDFQENPDTYFYFGNFTDSTTNYLSYGDFT